MALDLEPVLDLQPVESTGALDLQPVQEDGPSWHAAPPEPGLPSRALESVRRFMSPLTGPTESQRMQDSVVMADGSIAYKPAGGKVDQEGFFPALSHPMVAIPRVPQQSNKLLQAGAGAVNAVSGFAEFFESPLGLATAGFGTIGGALTKRLMAGGYAADMAAKVPEAARHAGETSVNGTLQQQVEADLGLGAQVVLPATLAAHALVPGAKPAPATVPAPKIFSEFGGETVETPGLTTAETLKQKQPEPKSNVNETPPLVQSPKTEVPSPESTVQSPKTPDSGLRTPDSTPTVPESPDTLHGQIVKLHEGRAPAVYFGPQDVLPDWATKDERFDVTPAADGGQYLYDTAAYTKDEIARLDAANQRGTVLGYGVPDKPAQPTGVITVRTRSGTELRAVVVDEASAPAALKAAQQYAGPEDVVRMESPQEVIARRLDATRPVETERQRMARENVETMAELRKQKSEDPNTQTPKLDVQPVTELPADVTVKVEGIDRRTGDVVEREMPAAKAGKWLEGRRSVLQKLLECLAGL